MNYEAKYTIDSHNLILKTITYSELLLFIYQKCFRMTKNSFCQMWTCLNTKTSSHKTLMASSCSWNAKHVYQLLYFTSEYQVNWKNLTLHALTYTSHAFLEEEVEAQRLCQHTDFFSRVNKVFVWEHLVKWGLGKRFHSIMYPVSPLIAFYEQS